MSKLLERMHQFLEEGEDVALATVIDNAGSTPRSGGSQMVVRSDDRISGTIGGGLVEAEVMNLAREVLKTGISQVRTVNLTGATVAATDRMICGGRMEILLECIKATPKNRVEFLGLLTALEDNPKSCLVIDLGGSGGRNGVMKRCLVQEGKVVWGEFPYPVSLLQSLTLRTAGEKLPGVLKIETRRFFVEPILSPATVFLFGAGHVSQQVALVAALVNFRTVVVDDRPEFANQERFPRADEISVPASFEQAFEDLAINRDSYLVIVTRGHVHDKTVLARALRSNAGYVGMIGSRKKRNKIYEALLEEGFTLQDLDRVHCPIGLNIGGETPEEIAVSIVAELIQERARRDGTWKENK